MKIQETKLAGVLVLEPRVFRDARGSFMETWSERTYRDLGIDTPFVQDNLSRSTRGVLRGLHFQNPLPQGKLVTVLQGCIYDVVVDLRVASATFGQWWAVDLDSEQPRQLWVPDGFAHGFQVTSETALVMYKCTRAYAPEHERSLCWQDGELGIDWPIPDPVLSDKDRQAPLLRDIPREHLFGAASPPPDRAHG